MFVFSDRRGRGGGQRELASVFPAAFPEKAAGDTKAAAFMLRKVTTWNWTT